MSDDVRLALVVGGVVMILIAILWRTLAVLGRRRRLHAGLAAIDPQDRAARRDRARRRRSPPVGAHPARARRPRDRSACLPRDPLAVARRQWEPVDTMRVRQLREWASQGARTRHGTDVSSFGPAVTRLSDMGGPRPPEPDAQPVAATTTEPAHAAPQPEEAGVSWHAEPNAP